MAEEEKVDINKLALKVFDVLDDYSPYSSFLDQSTLSNVDEWIDTGSKMLNAVISGSLYGGIPKGRVTLLAGESACIPENQKIQIYRMRSKKGAIPVKDISK